MKLTAVGEYHAWKSGIPGTFAWRHGDVRRTPRPFRVAPHWYAGIVVRRVWSDSSEVTEVSVETHGPAESAFIYDPGERVEQIGIAIAAEHTRAVIGLRCDDIPNHNLDGAIKRDCIERQRVKDAALSGASVETVIGLLGAAILANLNDRPAIGSAISPALTAIRAGRELTSLRSLALKSDLSERQFRRRFIDLLGCSPKRYIRILRLQRILNELDDFHNPDWADLALKHGFSDQSHLIREFTSLMKITPIRAQKERKLGVSDLSNTEVPVFSK